MARRGGVVPTVIGAPNGAGLRQAEAGAVACDLFKAGGREMTVRDLDFWKLFRFPCSETLEVGKGSID